MAKLQLLVPMDGTEFSRKIEPQIRKLFTPDQWALQLLHVARVPVDPGAASYEPATVGPDYRLYMYGYELPGANLHPMYDEEHLEDFRQMLENDLQNEVREFESQGYEVSASVHFGEPANAIVSYAEENHVDLVAMATHHRKGLDRLLHGSVARRALNHLSIPALLLKVDYDEDTEADEDGAGDRTADTRHIEADPSRRLASGYVAGGSTGQMDTSRADRGHGRGVSDASGRGGRPTGAADSGGGGGKREGHPGAQIPAKARDGRSTVQKDDQIVTPAETAPATLSGMKGRGVLTIVFDDHGKSVGSQGSWFPEDPEADLSQLEQAARSSRAVIFEGRSIDAETAGHDDDAGEQVRREVQVTSVRRYRDYGGDVRNLVSFELVGEPDMTDVPDQYTREEFNQLSLEQVADISGLEPRPGMTPQEEVKFREKAWASYELDIEHRDEWGTARQNTALPHGE